MIQGCLVATVKLNASSFSQNQIYHKNPDLVAKVDSFCQLQNALRDDIFKMIYKMSFCVHSCIYKLVDKLKYWQQIFWLNYKRQTGIRKLFCGWPFQKSLSLKHRFKLAWHGSLSDNQTKLLKVWRFIQHKLNIMSKISNKSLLLPPIHNMGTFCSGHQQCSGTRTRTLLKQKKYLRESFNKSFRAEFLSRENELLCKWITFRRIFSAFVVCF